MLVMKFKSKEKKKLRKKYSLSPLFGRNRSFSNRCTSRKFNLNLQRIKINGIKVSLPVNIIKSIERKNLNKLK